MAHKSGFVNIVGSPNVGKSTLMNQLMGEKLSIVTSKAQTTRHRILGILNDDDYQIVFSDTPGVVNAAYKLHETMMDYVNTSLKDADVLLFITDTIETDMNHKETLVKIKKLKVPVLCIINKIDLSNQADLTARVLYWQEQLPSAAIFPISALHNANIDQVWQRILTLIPENPPYYDKEEISDQVDLPVGARSGLEDALNILKGVKGVGRMAFTSADVVRHDLVARIVEAYDAAGAKRLQK